MNSSKSYVLSVCLVGVFGTLGVHHFYLGRWFHGVFDLSLVVMTVIFFIIYWPLAVATLVLDVIHTVYFMYKLIVGEYRDGAGRFVGIPS
jgi:TM2 domain-containing membrane protein YozV